MLADLRLDLFAPFGSGLGYKHQLKTGASILQGPSSPLGNETYQYHLNEITYLVGVYTLICSMYMHLIGTG